MNTEIISQEIKNNISTTFTFSKPVQQFFVGFSRCLIQYPFPDHHVKEITIDLTKAQKSNNKVIVEPKLILKDTGNHSESQDSCITVVVIATIGEGNPLFQMKRSVKTDIDYELPPNDPILVKSALSLSFVQFPASDHHLQKYYSIIKTVIEPSKFNLKGESFLKDNTSNSGKGKVFGSVLIYTGNDSKLLSADFSSKEIGSSGLVCFGESFDGFDPMNYSLACFITRYKVSFKKSEDHHLLLFDVSAEIGENKIFEKEGSLYAELNLKSYLSDNGKNQFNIPHNSVNGFVIALNNKE